MRAYSRATIKSLTVYKRATIKSLTVYNRATIKSLTVYNRATLKSLIELYYCSLLKGFTVLGLAVSRVKGLAG